jgi:hypothetical protein
MVPGAEDILAQGRFDRLQRVADERIGGMAERAQALVLGFVSLHRRFGPANDQDPLPFILPVQPLVAEQFLKQPVRTAQKRQPRWNGVAQVPFPAHPGKTQQPDQQAHIERRFDIKRRGPPQQAKQFFLHDTRRAHRQQVAGNHQPAVAVRGTGTDPLLFDQAHRAAGLRQVVRAGHADHSAPDNQDIARRWCASPHEAIG